MTKVKLIELVKELQARADLLKSAYPGAFPQEVRPGYFMQRSRYSWEVRIGAAHAALEKAIEKLKSACAEADDIKITKEEEASETVTSK